MVFMILVVTWVYFFTHGRLRDEYLELSTQLINDSAAAYQIGADQSGNWVLQINGRVIRDPGVDDTVKNAPLGIGNYASTRGVLSEFAAKLSDVNSLYGAKVESILSSARGNYGNDSSLIPAGLFLDDLEGFLTVSKTALDEIKQKSGIENFTGLESIFSGAQMLSFGKIQESETAKSDNPQVVKLGRDAQQNFLTNAVEVQVVKMSAEQKKALRDQLSQAANTAVISTFGDPIAKGSDNKTLLPNQLKQKIQAELQQRLSNVIIKEVGFFYTLSYFRWIEVIFFAMFGVLIQGCVRLVHASVNQQARRELGYYFPESTFAKLFYSPLLVVVVFFLIDYIGAPEAKLALGQGSLAMLGLAAWLGMHPNSSYRLVRKAFKAIVSDDVASSKNDLPPPPKTERKVVALPPPKTAAQLKSNIMSIHGQTLKASKQ